MKQNERININSVCRTYQDGTGGNQQYCTSNRSRDSVVDIVTGYGLDDRGIGV
jgi:hypothetical protein